jgi:CDP-glucose 4,6-dehydratase
MSIDLFAGGYAGRRVLVTGHTGAVGTWLTRWLAGLGADVVGLSRGRREPAMPPPAGVRTVAGDVTGPDRLRRLLRDHRTELIFHLAGQAVVADGFAAPYRTFADNVLGTVAVLDAALHEARVRAVVLIGTPADGVLRADAPLAPYAGSKVAAEAAAAGYAHELTQRAAGRVAPLAVAVARPGVMLGGDWTPGRLLTDVVTAIRAGRPVTLRGGGSVRPWQHVLDGVSGILTLGARLASAPLARRRHDFGCPATDGGATTADVVAAFLRAYGSPHWPVIAERGPGSDRLTLDCAVAGRELGWRPVWELDRTAAAAARWYLAYGRPGALGAVADAVLGEYVADARRAAAGSAVA